ncbi:MAG: inositol monophosphatase family protein [bacterium]
MNEQDLQHRLVVAVQAARQAGQGLLRHYAARDRLVIDQKGINDFVSQADRESEELIFAMLAQAFPTDALLGEESGHAGAAQSDLVWCIDPLDGTSNFLKGAHNWCVSIGLLDHGLPVLGVIYDPLRGEMFAGVPGQGMTVNGMAATVSRVAALDHAVLGLGHNARVPLDLFATETTALLATGLAFRQLGAGALMLAYVAAGRFEGYSEYHMWPWDAVAGLALIAAAGGVFAPYKTAPVEAGDRVLASNGLLQSALRQVMLTTGLEVPK